jgi:glutaredoxin
MSRRIVEVFSAGCPACDVAVGLVRKLACPSCDVRVLDMRVDTAAQAKAKQYGIQRVPAIVVDGALAGGCQGGIDEATLKALGIGSAL